MNQWKTVERHKVFSCDEYWFEIDEFRREQDGAQFLKAHIRFNKFSPKILKQAKANYRLLRKFVKAPLFAADEEDGGDKWVRFISHFGFQPTDSEVDCRDGKRRRLFKSIGI